MEFNKISVQVLEAITAVVGADNVLTSHDSLEKYSTQYNGSEITWEHLLK